MDGLFGPDDVVYAYTDAMALEDGVLLDLPALGVELRFRGRPVDRITCALFEALQPYVAHHADPANGLLRILRTKLQHAVYLAGPEGAAHMYELPSGSDDPIWLVQNELGSWTAMFASDY
jgi:hypothetical protein